MSKANEVTNPSECNERVERIVKVQNSKTVPSSECKECCIELIATGEWLVARFNHSVDKWEIAYHEPVDEVSPCHVSQWFALEDVFAT